jgi:hypothetical protein
MLGRILMDMVRCTTVRITWWAGFITGGKGREQGTGNREQEQKNAAGILEDGMPVLFRALL